MTLRSAPICASRAAAFLTSAVLWPVLLMLVPATELRAQPLCTSHEGPMQVITGAEIARSGAVRLTDVLHLIPSWQLFSTDNYFWTSEAGVGNIPGGSSWTLVVDGQVVDLSVFEQSYLNAYPIDPGLIDSVEIATGPVICPGIYAPGGMLHIHTRGGDKDVSLRATGGAANETGDPGPYRYGPNPPPNVDRSGPTASASATMAGERWHTRATLKTDEHHVTDPRLLPHVRKLYKSELPPRHVLQAQRLAAQSHQPFGSFTVSGDHSELRHFRFVPALGYEVPTMATFSRAGLAGTLSITRQWAIFVAGGYEELELGPHEETPGLDLSWTEQRLRGHAGLSLTLPRGRAMAGFSTGTVNGRARSWPGPAVISSSALYGGASVQASSDVSLTGSFRAGYEEAQVLGAAALGVTLRPDPEHEIGVSATTTRIPPRQSYPSLFWVQQGLRDSLVIGNAGNAPLRTLARRNTARTNWRWTPDPSLVLGADVAFSWFENALIPTYDRTLVRETDEFQNEIEFFQTQESFARPVNGMASQVTLQADLRPLPTVRARIHYARARLRSDDPRFTDAWARIPIHRTYASVTYVPLDRLSLFLRVRREDRSSWPSFEQDVSRRTYPSALARTLLVDLAIRKRFWYDHIQASIVITNLLDANARRHPVGSSSALTIHARAEVSF